MESVCCHICGWEGYVQDLVVEYIPNPKEPGDVIPEIVCPNCGNDAGLDYLEGLPVG